MNTVDRDYLLERARQEAERAQQATDRRAAAAHRELSDRYGRMADDSGRASASDEDVLGASGAADGC